MTNRDESETSQRGTGQARLTEVLMREFQRLVRLASGMGLDRSSIEDILQDVSMQALKHDLLSGQRDTPDQCLDHSNPRTKGPFDPGRDTY